MSPSGLEELLERDIARGNQRLGAMAADFLTDKNGSICVNTSSAPSRRPNGP